MKAILRIFAAMMVLAVVLPLVQCGKEEIPVDPRTYLYDKWWYNDQGLGDYFFAAGGTYEYSVPYNTGQWQWYNDIVDSMKVVQSTGGNWTLWFHEITDSSFVMSQSNEDHQNMYNYSDTKP